MFSSRLQTRRFYQLDSIASQVHTKDLLLLQDISSTLNPVGPVFVCQHVLCLAHEGTYQACQTRLLFCLLYVD